MNSHAPIVGLVGDWNRSVPAHPRIDDLLPALGVDHRWIPTTSVTSAAVLSDLSGIWVVPGSPYESMAGALLAIRHAREQQIPYLGTCGGFQHALLEWARNVLGIAEADDAQSAPDAQVLLITPLTCSMLGEEHPLNVAEGSRLAAIYGATTGRETYHCCYGLNEDFSKFFAGEGLCITAWDEHHAPRAVELCDHPFFLGTLFQPELASDRTHLHPILRAFASSVHEYAAIASERLDSGVF
jgi:CTP synthase (UTP-ammonia lyase)